MRTGRGTAAERGVRCEERGDREKASRMSSGPRERT